MIEYIRGTVITKSPTAVTLECNGLGYELSISLNTSNNLTEGSEVLLFTHEIIREDAYDLYGFSDLHERALFRLLISVNGVGPNSARVMLSSYPPAELASKIANGNEEGLQAVKGIGSKTAQRIIVDLRKKIMTELSDLLDTKTSTEAPIHENSNHTICEEAVQAFVALGYPLVAAKKVVQKIAKEYPNISINEMIKIGLRMF